DVQDHDVDGVAFLHDLRRVLHALGPRHVGDVDQPVDSWLDLHERAEARQVPDFALNPGADRVFLGQNHPRILLRLLHAEPDLLYLLSALDTHRLDRFADRDDLRWMADVASPAHLTDVDQTFNAGLELDERAVIRDRHDLALDPRTDRIFLRDVL